MTQPPPDPATLAVPPLPKAPPTSGLAVASLICGIAGVCTGGVGGIVGIILGIVALGKIKRSGGAMGGRGLAIAAIIVGAVTLVMGAIFLGMPVVVYLFARDQREWNREVWDEAKEDAAREEEFLGGDLNWAPGLPLLQAILHRAAPAVRQSGLALGFVTAAVPMQIVRGGPL